MVDQTSRKAGSALLRIALVVAVVLGVMLVLVGLTQANVTGLVLGVVLVAVAGYHLVRRR